MTIHKLPKATSSRGRASGGNALSQSRRLSGDAFGPRSRPTGGAAKASPAKPSIAIANRDDLGEWLLHRSGYRLSLSERIERWFGLPAWQLAIMFAVFAGVCAGIVSL